MAGERTEHKLFYVAMAVLLLATSVGGFMASYLRPVAAGNFVGPTVVHLHAAVAFAWMLLFVVQTALAAAGRMTNHQSFGMFGIALATAMVFSGLMIATKNMSVGIAGGHEEGARMFAVFPVTITLLFGGFFAAAIANINRPDVHKRLMLVAAIMTMPPAAGRVLGRFALEGDLPRQIVGATPATLTGATIASLAADVFLLLAIAYDWRTRGRPHPAYLVSLVVVLAVQGLRLPLAETEAWRAVTNVLLSLGS
jgi:hypothetical protein